MDSAAGNPTPAAEQEQPKSSLIPQDGVWGGRGASVVVVVAEGGGRD